MLALLLASIILHLPIVRLAEQGGPVDVYQLFNMPDGVDVDITGDGVTGEAVEPEGQGQPVTLRVLSAAAGVFPYTLIVKGDAFSRTVRRTLVNTVWSLRVFAFTHDPQTDLAGWRQDSQGEKAALGKTNKVDLPLGHRGPSTLDLGEAIKAAAINSTNYGIIAKAVLPIRNGKWRIKTLSADGVRVTLRRGGGLGDQPSETVLIDDWTAHAAKENAAVFEVAANNVLGMEVVEIEVEYFDLDAEAMLRLEIEAAE